MWPRCWCERSLLDLSAVPGTSRLFCFSSTHLLSCPPLSLTWWFSFFLCCLVFFLSLPTNHSWWRARDSSVGAGQRDGSGSVDHFYYFTVFFLLRHTYTSHCSRICAFLLHRLVSWEQWEMPHSAEEVGVTARVGVLGDARSTVEPPCSDTWQGPVTVIRQWVTV